MRVYAGIAGIAVYAGIAGIAGIALGLFSWDPILSTSAPFSIPLAYFMEGWELVAQDLYSEKIRGYAYLSVTAESYNYKDNSKM